MPAPEGAGDVVDDPPRKKRLVGQLVVERRAPPRRGRAIRRSARGAASCLSASAEAGRGATRQSAWQARPGRDAHGRARHEGQRQRVPLQAGATISSASLLARIPSTRCIGPAALEMFGERGGGIAVMRAVDPGFDAPDQRPVAQPLQPRRPLDAVSARPARNRREDREHRSCAASICQARLALRIW